MGIAVIIPNVNYQDANLGKVTLQQGVPLRSMTIVGPDEITEPTLFNVNFFPANTSQRGVAWSIVSGSSYASINAETGELTPIVGAAVNDVVVRATSTADNTIYAEKSIVVSFGMAYIERTGLVSDGTAYITTDYLVKRNSKIIYEYKIDAYPTLSTSTIYRTIWAAYTGESSPVSRHLLSLRTNPPSGFIYQSVAFARSTTTASDGFFAENQSARPPLNTRIRQELSLFGFESSYNNTSWIRTEYDTFTENTEPISIFNRPGGTAALEMTFYAFKAMEGDVLALNLVPCTLATTIDGTHTWDGNPHYVGENGFWDKVGKKFYGNVAESGSFSVVN